MTHRLWMIERLPDGFLVGCGDVSLMGSLLMRELPSTYRFTRADRAHLRLLAQAAERWLAEHRPGVGHG